MEKVLISKSRNINNIINYCFNVINKDDILKFKRKFRTQPHDESQIMHTFRELLLGVFLSSNGHLVRYDFKIDNKTPDWVVFNKDNKISGVVELINFHADKRTENEVTSTMNKSGVCFWYPKNNKKRLFQKLEEKVIKYKEIIKKYSLPYIITLFGDCISELEKDEIIECLQKDYNGGLFKKYSDFSGLLFFEDSNKYIFKFFENPYAENKIILPSGELNYNSEKQET